MKILEPKNAFFVGSKKEVKKSHRSKHDFSKSCSKIWELGDDFFISMKSQKRGF